MISYWQKLLRLSCLVTYVLSCSRAHVLTCPTCSRASRAFCPTYFRASRALCFMCLVPYVASCLALYEPFLLRYPFVVYLCTLCSNITFYALAFPCFTLLFFCLFSTCDFRGEFSKLKTNIVFQ